MSSLRGSLKKIDFYRRVPIDLTEPTAVGAVISVTACVIMTLLFFGEVVSYVSPPQRSDMYVAPDVGQGSRLRVNFNMTYHKLPCFALSFDVLDVLGRHEVGVAETTTKTRVAPDGTFIGRFMNNEAEFGSQVNEGCNTEGYVFVNKVPGNFHVSAHGLGHYVQRYLGGNINVQHTIHHLGFGDVILRAKHGFEGEVHPLDDLVQRDEAHMHYEYYLDIVPTVYGKRIAYGKEVQRGYQFTANFHKMEVPHGHMPAAFFRYQLSPITVEYSVEKTSFIHFLTYVCAMVGGVFTVAGMLSRALHTSAVQFQRRFLGKDA